MCEYRCCDRRRTGGKLGRARRDWGVCFLQTSYRHYWGGTAVPGLCPSQVNLAAAHYTMARR